MFHLPREDKVTKRELVDRGCLPRRRANGSAQEVNSLAMNVTATMSSVVEISSIYQIMGANHNTSQS